MENRAAPDSKRLSGAQKLKRWESFRSNTRTVLQRRGILSAAKVSLVTAPLRAESQPQEGHYCLPRSLMIRTYTGLHCLHWFTDQRW